MKKTRVMISGLLDVNHNIERLEESGWEVVNFKDIKLSNGEVYILLMAQKEDDKSVYEKIYLLEKYCTNYRYKHKNGNLCKGCRIENMCDKYEGNGAVYWDFEDVKKAYEVMRDGDR